MEIVYILIGAILIGGTLTFGHIWRQKKALMNLQADSQKLTEKAIKKCLPLVLKQPLELSSPRPIADIWGKGVLAFEYQGYLQRPDNLDLNAFRQALTVQLKLFAKEEHLTSEYSEQVFVISDLWLKENTLHIDLAYVINRATASYIRDVSQLDGK